MAKDEHGNKIPKGTPAAAPTAVMDPPKVKKEKKDKAPKAAKSGNDLGHGLSAPGSGGQFNAETSLGRLLLITPSEIEKDIVTSNGTADATRCAIVILDGKGGPESIDDALIFQKVVQGQLREAINNRSRVVGRLFLDQSAKKAGQNAPYKLSAPTEADIKLATDYLDSLDPLR